jgi:GrpB-like predicted nucleotidyltransferase (UPF0157 family)
LIVEAYNPEWPRWFLRLQTFLYRNLVGTYHAIEHAGSTAVPGMWAKPIIDVDVVLRPGMFENARGRLIAAGYEHEGDKGVPGREAFRLQDEALKAALPAHHLYLMDAAAAELRRHRAFRDFLLAHPDWVERLSVQKREVAQRAGNDRDAYQAGKAAMVEEILALALQPALSPVEGESRL